MKHTSWLSLPLATLSCLIPLSARAQVTPDGTTSTTVNQDGNNFAIEQGDRVGDNLFHSFNEFSVPTNGSAAFNNAGDIANIFSRVTGSSISSIDGLISAEGVANLFLINPNGIIFGQNASLQLGGSFFASTADSLLFEGDTEFSAVDPQAPPLLEVSIPIGARFRDNPGDIVNRSIVQNSAGEFVGLEVDTGKNITLLGGDINFEGGNLTTRDGNIYLGGLAEVGTVNINDDASLSFLEDTAKANVNFSNFSSVFSQGTNDRNITIDARNLKLTQKSGLLTGIEANEGNLEAQSANITIDVTENISVDDSFIINEIASEGTGSLGNVTINTANLSLVNGAQISSGILGEGRGGLVSINATELISLNSSAILNTLENNTSTSFGNAGDLKINAANLDLTNGSDIGTVTRGIGDAAQIAIDVAETVSVDDSKISSSVIGSGQGDAGSIEIETIDLSLIDGSEVNSSTSGQGNAGLIEVNAKDTISLDQSSIFSQVNSTGVGDAGVVQINTANLYLFDGARISGSVLGIGNGSLVSINASELISLDSISADSTSSAIGSALESGASGSAGDVEITAANLNLLNGSAITNSVRGVGNTGQIKIDIAETLSVNGGSIFSQMQGESSQDNVGVIEIEAANLNLNNNGTISSSTSVRGNAGSVKINAEDTISLDQSSIFSQVKSTGVGDAGVIQIETGNLNLTNSSLISNTVFGNGKGSLISIGASENISLDSGAIVSILADDAIGNAGDLKINATNFKLINDSDVNTLTRGIGDAGQIAISVSETIFAENSNISSQVNSTGVGNAGEITVNTANLTLTNGAQISSSVFGEGIGGLLSIDATEKISLNSSNTGIASVLGANAIGSAGDIAIMTTNLNITDDSAILNDTRGIGNAGQIVVDSENITMSSGNIFSNAEENSQGNAGRIEINTANLSLSNSADILASTRGKGNAGSILINASNTISLDGTSSEGEDRSGISTQVDDIAVGDAGAITINTTNLSVFNDAVISSIVIGEGNGGLVSIDATKQIFLDFGFIGTILDEDAVGSAGDIKISTTNLNLTNDSEIAAATLGIGNAGQVTIDVAETISADGGGFFSNVQGENAQGNAGGIKIKTTNLSLTNSADVSTQTDGSGNAGSIEIDASDTISLDEGFIFSRVTEVAEGNSGGIDIATKDLTLDNNSEINIDLFGQTDPEIESGNLNLTIQDILILRNGSSISGEALSNNNGGNITINADNGLIIAFPNQDNDIIANAAQGNGGNIEIFTQALFGIEERSSTPPNQTNDIDASSEFGLQGDFSLNTPDFDPTTGLINLPASVGDASDQISQNPCEQGVGSEFLVTGKGGLPPNVNESLNSEETQVRLIEPVPSQTQTVGANGDRLTQSTTPEAVPAQGWIFNDRGEVTLTAYKTTDTEIKRSSPEPINSCSEQMDK